MWYESLIGANPLPLERTYFLSVLPPNSRFRCSTSSSPMNRSLAPLRAAPSGIQKQSPQSPSRDAQRRRSPDVKDMPRWLVDPLRSFVQLGPNVSEQLDACSRPIYDWDAWAREHLKAQYWDASHSSWLSCIRDWAAACPQNGLVLFPSTTELVHSIVRVTVAESFAHLHSTEFPHLDVKKRRHINTTASRQRENSANKVTLYHVVHLALARFGFDVLLNKIDTSPQFVESLKKQMQFCFQDLHSKAERHCEPSSLRACVVQLTQELRACMRGMLYVPWYQVPKSALPGGYPLELSARGFVTGLPKPHVDFLTMTPLVARNKHLSSWISHLDSSVFDGRWYALLKFLRAHYKCDGSTLGDVARGEAAYVIMLTVLDAAAPGNKISHIIATVATEHSLRSPMGIDILAFRDLLDLKLDRPTCEQINLKKEKSPMSLVSGNFHL